MAINVRALAMVMLMLSVVYVEGAEVTKYCNLTMDQLLTCKPYVMTPDLPDPSPECCAGLANADVPCLCSFSKSLMFKTLDISPTLAKQLPAKCKLPTPAQC
ncbi:hypothetical protein QJS10_CPA06g01095 [Acorus calamus]|uniref:Bifunctional inhibitor/plant lipid transfer protein/seed storage helical domain-containing protein n=1 Tax=Acorus calamus TaxID=4465 RepID=A0AAV9EHZ6_ACOCL|nr:hypothetical protein QJS10_CPA06g01095 [Acorus calamus]